MSTDGKAWSSQLIYWFEWQEVNPSEKTRCSIAALYNDRSLGSLDWRYTYLLPITITLL